MADRGESGRTLRQEQRMERDLLAKLLKMAEEGVVDIDFEQVNGMVADQIAISRDPKQKARERSRATEVVRRFVNLNIDVALKMIDKVAPDQHEHTGTIEHEHRITAKELLESPDYVEWLRQRERDSDSRLVRANGHEGNGKPLDDGPARNGHRP